MKFLIAIRKFIITGISRGLTFALLTSSGDGDLIVRSDSCDGVGVDWRIEGGDLPACYDNVSPA